MTAPSSGQVPIGNAGGTAYAPVSLGGDVSSVSAAGAVTPGKVNGVSYGASPGTNTVPVVTAANTTTYQTVPAAAGGTGSSAVPAAGQVAVGNASGTAYTPVSMSGDGTLASTGTITITKTNGTPFGANATLGVGSGLTSSGGNLNLYQFGLAMNATAVFASAGL